MKVLKRKKFIAGIMLFMFAGASSIVTAADSYSNSKSFTLVSLPHGHANTTFASGTKTTDRNYGQLKITYIGGGSSGVNVWMRSKKSNGEWDPLNSKLRTFTKAGTKKMYYKNSSTGYTIPYKKGTKAQVRGENKTNTSLIHDSVSGIAYFN